MKHKLYLFALLSSIWILYFLDHFINEVKISEGKYKTIYKGFSFDII